jgi:hypothetical protein
VKPSFPIAIAATLLLTACAEEEMAGQQLLVPNDVPLQWDESFNGLGDGLGAVVPIDVMVFEGLTGEPLGSVSLDVDASYEGVGIPVLVEVVEPDSCMDCVFVWDAYRDRYVDLVPENADSTAVVQTDVDGLVRVFLYVDAFPVDENGGFAPVSVTVSSEVATEQFIVTAG